MLWPLKCRLLEDISTKSMSGLILIVQWFIGQVHVLGDRIPMYGTPMGEILKKSNYPPECGKKQFNSG